MCAVDDRSCQFSGYQCRGTEQHGWRWRHLCRLHYERVSLLSLLLSLCSLSLCLLVSLFLSVCLCICTLCLSLSPPFSLCLSQGCKKRFFPKKANLVVLGFQVSCVSRFCFLFFRLLIYVLLLLILLQCVMCICIQWSGCCGWSY